MQTVVLNSFPLYKQELLQMYVTENHFGSQVQMLPLSGPTRSAMRANTCISYCISWTEIHPLAHIARYPHGGTDVVRLRYRRICADVPPARVWPLQPPASRWISSTSWPWTELAAMGHRFTVKFQSQSTQQARMYMGGSRPYLSKEIAVEAPCQSGREDAGAKPTDGRGHRLRHSVALVAGW